MAQPWKHPDSGIYYIRRRIPKDLITLLGRGGLYKVSLDTRIPAEAKIRHAAELVKCDQLFEQARLQLRHGVQLNAHHAVQMAGRWARRELEGMEKTGDFTSWLINHGSHFEPLGGPIDGRRSVTALLEDPLWLLFLETLIADELPRYNQPPVPTDSIAFRHLLEAFAAQAQRLAKTAFDRSEHDHVTPLQAPALTPLSFEAKQEASPPLSRLFEDWKAYNLKLGNGGRDVAKRVVEYGGTMKVFIELYGDLPVTSITRATVNAFATDLLKLPAGGVGRRALTAPQLIARAETENLPTLSHLTVKNRLMALSSVLSYAVRLGTLAENAVTASGVTGALTKAAKKSSRAVARKHYLPQELKQIFSSPVFQGTWKPPRASFGEAWFWVPLLLYYTGARREEVAQMNATEVRCSEDDIWFLDLLSTPDDEGLEEKRTVKTAGSRRKVPLHPDLIALGFVDYATSLPAKGQLFPLLEANPSGYYSVNFGKRWSEYLKKVVGLDSKVRPSHGFRHTFITLCREQGIPEELRDALTGHDNGAVSRKYGERALLPQLLEQVAKVPSVARATGLLPPDQAA